MFIAEVIGTVVATRKHERLVGSKIQIVQPLEPRSGEARGDTLVAVDAVGAGVGERVWWCWGAELARLLITICARWTPRSLESLITLTLKEALHDLPFHAGGMRAT